MLFKEPIGFINSSFTVFFHISVILLAPFFAGYFPDELGKVPLIVCLALPVVLFWFFWALRNHSELDTVTFAIPAFALVCALFALASVIRGPLSEGLAPTTTYPFIPLLNLFYVSFTGSAPILASAVMYYGACTYLAAALAALTLEFGYDNFLRKFFPTRLQRKLQEIDLKIDQKLFTFSDKNWIMGQSRGSLYIAIALVALALLYTMALLSGISN